MTKGPRFISILVGLLAVCASPAAAHLPKFSNKSPAIVPGTSIGGLKAGVNKTAAVKAWGAPNRCVPNFGATWCQYLVPSKVIAGPTLMSPAAGFWLRGGKVAAIEIALPNNSAIAAKLERLKTAKKIRLGSTMAAARAKYSIKPPGPGEANLSRAKLRQGKRCTLFYAPAAPYVTITSIRLGPCGSLIF